MRARDRAKLVEVTKVHVINALGKDYRWPEVVELADMTEAQKVMIAKLILESVPSDGIAGYDPISGAIANLNDWSP